MIRIVGYLVPDASMPHAKQSAWFTIWEAPPNLPASRALKQAAARMLTWEQRLKVGSYNGTTRVAIEVVAPIPLSIETDEFKIRVLEVEAGWGTIKPERLAP